MNNTWNKAIATNTILRGSREIIYFSHKYRKRYTEEEVMGAFDAFWHEFDVCIKNYEGAQKRSVLCHIPKKPVDAWERFLSALSLEKIV